MRVRELVLSVEVHMGQPSYLEGRLEEVIEHPKFSVGLVEKVSNCSGSFFKREYRLLELEIGNSLIHIARDHNMLVYSLETLVPKRLPPNLVMHTTDDHDDWNNHIVDIDEGDSNSKIKLRDLEYKMPGSRFGSPEDAIINATCCCSEVNYLAYAFWHSLVAKMRYILRTPKDVDGMWGYNQERTSIQRTILCDPDGNFYYPSQIQTEPGIKPANSKRLTVDFPITYFKDQVIIPELPCMSNIDVDYWFNRSDLNSWFDYKAAVAEYVRQCESVIAASPFVFIALSPNWTDKDKQHIPALTFYLVNRIRTIWSPAQPS